MGETIRFQSSGGPYGFLSCLARFPMRLGGKEWASVEHYFQAQKFAGTEHEEAIRNAASPAGATRMGRSPKRPLRADWEDVAEGVMRRALAAKFEQHFELRERLLATGDARLVSAVKADPRWGIGPDGEGGNRLGELLMALREELRQAVAAPLVRTLRAVVRGDGRSWVLFRHGTCVVRVGRDGGVRLVDEAEALLARHGPVHVATASADFGVLELTDGLGWAVSCAHPDIFTVVLSSEARVGASHLAVGVIGREKRNRDALTPLPIHVEDVRER